MERSDRNSLVDIHVSAECQLVCWSTYQPTLGQYGDMSVNVLTEISAKWWSANWSISRLALGRYTGHWLSVEYQSTASDISVKSLDCHCQMYKLCAFHPFLVNLKNLRRLNVRSSCATNTVVIKQGIQEKYCQLHKIQLTGKKIRTIKDNKVLVWNWWKTSKPWICPRTALIFLLYFYCYISLPVGGVVALKNLGELRKHFTRSGISAPLSRSY